MSKSTCRTRQKRSLDSWYNATLSTLIQFSEWIIHIRTVLTALWQKYYHCIQLSYLLNVTISCQTRPQQTVDLNTTPEQWLFQNLQDSLRYHPFSIPPHTSTSIETSWLFTQQQLSAFLFAIWILEFGKNNSVPFFFLIDLLSDLFTDPRTFLLGKPLLWLCRNN